MGHKSRKRNEGKKDVLHVRVPLQVAEIVLLEPLARARGVTVSTFVHDAVVDIAAAYRSDAIGLLSATAEATKLPVATVAGLILHIAEAIRTAPGRRGSGAGRPGGTRGDLRPVHLA